MKYVDSWMWLSTSVNELWLKLFVLDKWCHCHLEQTASDNPRIDMMINNPDPRPVEGKGFALWSHYELGNYRFYSSYLGWIAIYKTNPLNGVYSSLSLLFIPLKPCFYRWPSSFYITSTLVDRRLSSQVFLGVRAAHWLNSISSSECGALQLVADIRESQLCCRLTARVRWCGVFPMHSLLELTHAGDYGIDSGERGEGVKKSRNARWWVSANCCEMKAVNSVISTSKICLGLH